MHTGEVRRSVFRMNIFVSSLVSLLLLVDSACQGADQARQALDEARQLGREGRYEEALQKHMWFHDHALEIDPSWSGVRRSFALNDWVALGAKYPKALRVLEDIRDTKTDRLLANEANAVLFQDVEAINQAMGQPEATIQLFRKIGDTDPEFAEKVYWVIRDTLAKAGEYELARRFMGDPAEKLAEAKEALRPWSLPNGKEGPSLRRREEVFTRQVLELVNVLHNSGDLGAARKMQTDAVQLVETLLLKDVIQNSTAGEGAQWHFEKLTRSEAFELALSALKAHGAPPAEDADRRSKWVDNVRGVRSDRERYWNFEFDFDPDHPGTTIVLVYDDRDVNVFGAR